jgi:hypothetical protein
LPLLEPTTFKETKIIAMPAYGITLLENNQHEPIVRGDISGGYEKVTWCEQTGREDTESEGKSIISFTYSVMFTFHEDPQSYVILRTDATCEVYHSNAKFLSDRDLAICLSK